MGSARGGRTDGPDASLLEALADCAGDALCVLDPDRDFRLLFANDAACRRFGCSREQLLAAPAEGCGLDLAPSSVRDLSPSAPPLVYDTTLRRADGTRATVRVSLRRVDVDGRRYLLGALRDPAASTAGDPASGDGDDRYRDLVEHSADLICTHDLDGRLLSVNPAAELLLGYPPRMLIGKNIRDGLAPEARSRFDAYLEAIKRDGVASGLMHVLTATGETRYWEYHNTLRTEGVPAPVVRGMAHDVTERKRAEDALRESERRLRLAMEASEQGLLDVNVTAGVATVSPELATMLERGAEGFQLSLGELRELVHADDRGRVFDALREHLEGRSEHFRAEFRMRSGAGAWKWLLTHGSVVQRDADGKPRRLLAVHLDVGDLKAAEFERARRVGRRRVLFEQATDGIAVLDATGEIIEANTSLARLLGYDMPELHALRLPQWDEAFTTEDARPAYPDTPTIRESRLRRKDGSTVEVEVSYTLGEWAGQKLLFHVYRDITQRKRADAEQAMLQAQLLQAQKMESVGRLAGGIAHDFNNLLSVILGYCDLALESVADGPLRADLEEIHRAARRSADLTQRLLAFSRRQTAAPRVLDLNDAVAGVLKMLHRLMGEDIDLAWRPGAGLWAVAIDPTQVDSLLANLCVNARDAIAGVGRVGIETSNVAFDAAYCAEHVGFLPGEYVMLAVTDDGCGMSDEVLAHLFEPFFTTKSLGQGTGLGLATVYGTVKQNSGFISVQSQPGRGTTFKIFLPRVSEAVDAAPDTRLGTVSGRGETVLIVEDEPAILKLSQTILRGLGYSVMAARTPGEALRLAAAHAGVIDLLVTDVIMPEMNGRELADQLVAASPGLRCLFVSGYTADVIAHRGILHKGVHFLQKPFSRVDFAAKVREVLSEA
jgi:PAS domain S-box-containing protein